MFTFWIENKIFGLHSYISRSINVVLHYLTAIMIFKFILLLSQKRMLSFYLGLIFFVHAINSQVMIISIQRGAILATLTILCALYCALKSKFLLAIFFFILGVLSKEFAFIFAVLLLYFIGKNKEIAKSKKLLFSIFILAILFFPILHYVFLGEYKDSKPYTILEFFSTQIFYFPHYLGKIIFPFNIHYMYNYLPPDSFLNWRFILSSTMVFLFFLGITLTVKIYNKNALLPLILFYISVLPEFTFFNIPHLFFEHRLYLPLSFFLIFLGFIIPISSFSKKHHLFFISLTIYLSFATIYRSFEVSTEKKWNHNIFKYPSHDLVFHYNILFDMIKNKDDEKIEPFLKKIKTYASSTDSNIILLEDLYNYTKHKNKANLEQIGSTLIEKKYIRFFLRSLSVSYIQTALNEYVTEEMMPYQMASLTCPQLLYLDVRNTESSFVLSCIENIRLFLSNTATSNEDKKRKQLREYLKKIIEQKRFTLGPGVEKYLLDL